MPLGHDLWLERPLSCTHRDGLLVLLILMVGMIWISVLWGLCSIGLWIAWEAVFECKR
jgi:hypothetical protein